MKKQSRRHIFFFVGTILVILTAVAVFGVWLRREMISIRQREAENVLYYYNE